MEKKIKKYIYLINDVSSLLLKKERVKTEENAQKLRTVLIIVFILFLLSLALNIYFYIKA